MLSTTALEVEVRAMRSPAPATWQRMAVVSKSVNCESNRGWIRNKAAVPGFRGPAVHIICVAEGRDIARQHRHDGTLSDEERELCAVRVRPLDILTAGVRGVVPEVDPGAAWQVNRAAAPFPGQGWAQPGSVAEVVSVFDREGVRVVLIHQHQGPQDRQACIARYLRK